MRTKYVVDTSALIHNPQIWKQYSQCDIIIPIVVLNELDKLKKYPDETGRNARVCVRILDKISEQGDISTGILLDNDISLKVDAVYQNINDGEFGDPTIGDSQILACLVRHRQNGILVSQDINLRVKAKARGIQAISPSSSRDTPLDMYSGI